MPLLKRKHHYFILFFTIIIVLSILLRFIQIKNRKETELKNQQTIFNNVKIELKQKESNQDKIQQEIQKRIYSQNQAKRKKDSLSSILKKLQSKQIQSKKEEQNILQKIQQTEHFKLLRSNRNKTEQIQNIHQQLKINHQKTDQLDRQINRLHLEIERIK